MELTKCSANSLCERVIEQLAEWRVLPSVLQVGGIESRASSRILRALEIWLEEQLRTDLLVVPEYRLSIAPSTDETTDSVVAQAADKLLRGQRIDYAFVNSKSVGSSRLQVDTVVEVKTNYLCQPELQRRPVSACDQARAYRERCGANHAYVLYIVVSAVGAAPDQPRDAGWSYFREHHPVVPGEGPIAVPSVHVLGQHPVGDVGHQISWLGMGAQIWACVLHADPL